MDWIHDEARQALLLDCFFDRLVADVDAVAPIGFATDMANLGRLVVAIERIPPRAALCHAGQSRLWSHVLAAARPSP